MRLPDETRNPRLADFLAMALRAADLATCAQDYACWLLLWSVTPTDRALTGWAPLTGWTLP